MTHGAETVRTLLVWVVVAGVLVACLCEASEQGMKQPDVREPLDLETALSFASGQPRVRLTSKWQNRLPSRQPLYLDCHRFAYAGTDELANQRSRPMASLVSPATAQRLRIMERFFDVLLADLGFDRYSESNAAAYGRHDKAGNRFQLGQYSEIRAAKMHSRFLQARKQRTAAEAGRRLTRSLLAQALGRPQHLPRELTPPAMPDLPDEHSDLESVFYAAQTKNVWLAEQMRHMDTETRAVAEMELRQQLLEILLRLDVLAAAEGWLRTEAGWRDLVLERSRALYEYEVYADLGDSMAMQSEARLKQRKAIYCKLMAWAELSALQGGAVWPLGGPAKD